MLSGRSKGFGKVVAPKKSLQQQVRKTFRQIRLGERKYGSRVLQEVSGIEKDQQAEDRGIHQDKFPSTDSAGNQEDYARLHQKHWQEIVAQSRVDREIASLNFHSLSGHAPYEYLFYSEKIDRRNDGRVAEGTLKRYRHVEDGGWWVDGIDLLTFGDGLWGQFKPDNPRQDSNGKTVKYESPLKVPTEIIALRVPARIWELIARRYDVALPEDYQSLPFGAFWQWVIQNPQIPVVIVEGAKKAACILSCGYVAVALPGVYNGYRQPKTEFGEKISNRSLIPQLRVFAQSGRRIYLCFDSDSKRRTIRDVNNVLAETAKLFIKAGCEVGVMSWHPLLGKGVDDVIASHGPEQFDEIYRATLSFSQWQTHQSKRLTYSVDLLLNQRYLGELTPPTNKQLICLKAPKGTGKTEWLAWMTDPVIRSGERRVLLITHRVQLSTQTANRLGIPYVTESSEQGTLFGMGMCIDSLHPKSQARFNPEEWRGCWLIIDEVQQVIWHLLNSKTCQAERVSIIKNFKQLLLNIVNYGGKIFIADADLNDISIDFIKELLGIDIAPWIVENQYQFQQPWNVYCFGDKSPASLVKMLEEKLKAGEKHLLCVSGQKAKSKWGSRNLEAYLAKKSPSLRILRIDSESVADPKHPAYGCTANINEIIKDYDLVIATPTIETGVSIEEKHFDGVWGIFQGVQATDSVRQHLSRYRLPVPRYLWVRSVGINRVGNGATTVKGLLAGEHKKDKANVQKLIHLGLEESVDGNFEPCCLQTWAKMGVLINLGMSRYSQQILEDLASEGHHILDARDLDEMPKENESEALKEDITQTCDEEYLEYREAVSAADSVDDSKYERLSRQQCKTQSEQLEFRKAELERRYNVPVTPDLVEKDEDGWYAQLRTHYYFGEGRQFLGDRDKNVFRTAVVNGDGDYFKVDTNRKLISKEIDALDWLKFEELLAVDEITNFHPLAVEVFKKCKDPKNVYSLKLVLGIDFSKAKSPIQVLQSLMGLIGYRFPFLRREGGRGKQIRVWGKAAAEFERCPISGKIILDANGKAIPISDRRDEVFKAWLERDAVASEKAAAVMAAAAKNQSSISTEAVSAQHSAVSTQQLEDASEWLEPEAVQHIAELLQACDDSQKLFDLRKFIPAQALKAAVKFLSDEVKERIWQWVCWQNQPEFS
jgi:hypothetical protein